MSTYKLHYFDLRGRGETSRFLFKLAKQPFEDIRYSFEEWPTKKADSPFGQLPFLEVDGEVLCQTRCIERLLAKRFNRYGDTDMEQAKADMVIYCVEDMVQSYFKIAAGDEETKAERVKKWVDESLPDYLTKIEKFTTPTGFIPGKSMMWPDIALLSCVDVLETFALGGETLNLDKTPNLKKIFEMVTKDPIIAAWIEERPKTNM